MLDGLIQQIQGWGHKAHQHGRYTQSNGDTGSGAFQPGRSNGFGTLITGIGLAAATITLDADQRRHQTEHGNSNLRGTRQIRARYPGGVNRHRQGLHAQKLGSTNIVQGFQQSQADTHCNRRAGHRQHDPEKYDTARFTHNAGSLQQAGRLCRKHGARAQVYIGVEH